MKAPISSILLTLVLIPSSAAFAADALPAANRANWPFAGVPGGIPNRTTVCARLSPGASAGEIQTALATCPADQVVFLNAGTYSLSSSIKLSRDNVTLRGAVDADGWPTTILQFSSGASGWGLIDIAKTGYPGNNWGAVAYRAVNSGFDRGSTSMTLASAPSGLQPGQIFVLDQLDDENLVRNSTSMEGGGIWGRNGNRMLQQILRVKTISGSQITFEPAIASPYFRAAQQPQIYWFGSGSSQVVSRSGVENLKIVRTRGGGGTHNISIGPADSVWVKNIWSIQADSAHVRTGFVMNAEIRDSYFTLHDSVASANYAVWISNTSSTLIENNVMYNIPCAVGFMGSTANVFAYNFAANFPYSQSNWLPEAAMTSHGGHNTHNLFEGNYIPTIWADFYHGNSSYTSVVRNRLAGWESGKTGNTHAVSAHRYQDNYAVIGNVLGTEGYHTAYTGGSTAIWNVDADSLATMTRTGNFNFANKAIPASEGSGSDTIAVSYVYTSKPSWFGGLPWPAVDPTRASQADPTDIPAGYRYQYRKNPPTSSTTPEAPVDVRVE